MKILIGSKNQGKIREYQQMLHSDFEVMSVEDDFDVVEDGKSLRENTLIKAKAYYQAYRMPVICDDTGLFIEALNFEPGIYTSRFASGDYLNRCQRLIEKIDKPLPVAAYFESCVIFYDGNTVIESMGRLDGMIIDQMRGNHGFGFDPIFYIPSLDKTLAQLLPSQKNQISHRHVALQKLLPQLQNYVMTKRIEHQLLNYLSEVYKTENTSIVSRFLAGMSNYTYLVKVDNQQKVVRIPGENAELFVNRMHEKANLVLASQTFPYLAFEVFDDELGIKVTPYQDGTVLEVGNQPIPYQEIAESLKKLHQMGPCSKNDNDPFGRLAFYEKHVTNASMEYFKIRDLFLTKYQKFLQTRPLTFCHGDCHLSNIIATSDNQVMIVDYEFAGNNDYLYDIACFCNDGFTVAFQVLKAYLKDKDEAYLNEQARIVKMWFIYQSLQWYNVALIKEQFGMSEKLKIDFSAIAKWFLDQASEYLREIENKL